jgi:metal-responsive CopG/Arc/MetJ family transcriptional regulator
VTIKTAISIDESLFERAEALARELNISRSRLFALATQDFIERYDNQRLLDEINAACDEAPDAQERTQLQTMRAQQRRLVEGQW